MRMYSKKSPTGANPYPGPAAMPSVVSVICTCINVYAVLRERPSSSTPAHTSVAQLRARSSDSSEPGPSWPIRCEMYSSLLRSYCWRSDGSWNVMMTWCRSFTDGAKHMSDESNGRPCSFTLSSGLLSFGTCRAACTSAHSTRALSLGRVAWLAQTSMPSSSTRHACPEASTQISHKTSFKGRAPRQRAPQPTPAACRARGR